MRVYSINCNRFANGLYVSTPEELGNYVSKLMHMVGDKSIIMIRIVDMPEEEFASLPEFGGFRTLEDFANGGSD